MVQWFCIRLGLDSTGTIVCNINRFNSRVQCTSILSHTLKTKVLQPNVFAKFEGIILSPTKIHVVFKMVFNILNIRKWLLYWPATIGISMNFSCTLGHSTCSKVSKWKVCNCRMLWPTTKRKGKREEIGRSVVVVMMTENWCTFRFVSYKSKGRHHVSQNMNIQLHDNENPF